MRAPLSFTDSGKYAAIRVNRIPLGIVREILLHRASMWNLHKQITLRVYESGNYKSATESRKFMGRVTMAKG